MTCVVQKYGGTSVGSPEKIRQVARSIAATWRKGQRLAVVVSAMGKTTDEFLRLAKQVSPNPPRREMDMLLTAGERISMALLSMALADQGVDAISFTGSQSGIVTDHSHRRARIKRILGDRVISALERNQVAIVAGFQGVSEAKEITTLGLGGSDTTAVALACKLGAERCEIYTDVEGVFTADPRAVPDARLLRGVSYDFMLEYASAGAGVLHPRCVALAKKKNLSLQVMDAQKTTGGSQIGGDAGPAVGAVADRDRVLLEVALSRPRALSAFWDRAGAQSLGMFSPVFSERTASIFIHQEELPEWEELLSQLEQEEFISEYRVDTDRIPLSLVWANRRAPTLGAFLECLNGDWNRASQSDHCLTVAAKYSLAEKALRRVHAKFAGEGSA